ncbi:phage tail protein [Serratia sp. PAMC26656]|nr:phage tail protein [Serratia sp. PAMC26656]
MLKPEQLRTALVNALPALQAFPDRLRLNLDDGRVVSTLGPSLSFEYQSLTLTDHRGFTADQLVLELDDADGQVVMPTRNQVITLKLGWKGQGLVDKGKFTIDEVEHQGAPDKLTLRARSVDFRGSMNIARDHSYHDKTLGDIVNEIANRNRLGNTLATGLAEIKISHIDQTQETDAAFLTRLATMNGAVAAIKNERLLFLIPG